jgi:hypothetical protein
LNFGLKRTKLYEKKTHFEPNPTAYYIIPRNKNGNRKDEKHSKIILKKLKGFFKIIIIIIIKLD